MWAAAIQTECNQADQRPNVAPYICIFAPVPLPIMTFAWSNRERAADLVAGKPLRWDFDAELAVDSMMNDYILGPTDLRAYETMRHFSSGWFDTRHPAFVPPGSGRWK